MLCAFLHHSLRVLSLFCPSSTCRTFKNISKTLHCACIYFGVNIIVLQQKYVTSVLAHADILFFFLVDVVCDFPPPIRLQWFGPISFQRWHPLLTAVLTLCSFNGKAQLKIAPAWHLPPPIVSLWKAHTATTFDLFLLKNTNMFFFLEGHKQGRTRDCLYLSGHMGAIYCTYSTDSERIGFLSK